MFSVNNIFSCHDEVLVLPKQYCTLDAEFMNTTLGLDIGTPPDRFDEVQFLHFSAEGKPWSRMSRREYYGSRNHTQLVHTIDKWFEEVEKVCPGIMPAPGS